MSVSIGRDVRSLNGVWIWFVFILYAARESRLFNNAAICRIYMSIDVFLMLPLVIFGVVG